MSSFVDQFFSSVGTEAKLDLYNKFNLDKPYDFEADSPEEGKPPLYRITRRENNLYLQQTFIIQTKNQNCGSHLPLRKTKILPPQLTHKAELQQHKSLDQQFTWTHYKKVEYVCIRGSYTHQKHQYSIFITPGLIHMTICKKPSSNFTCVLKTTKTNIHNALMAEKRFKRNKRSK